MGVVSWLALVALVAYRMPTVSCANNEALSVTLIVYSNVDDLKDVVLNVTQVAADTALDAYGFLGVAKGKDCFASLRQDTKNIGNIYITNDIKCANEDMHKHGLLLVYKSGGNTLTAAGGSPFKATDTTQLGTLINRLIGRVERGSKPEAKKEEESGGVRVSVFVIILVGSFVGLLLALSCIFFQKYRAAASKTHPAEKPNCKSSKGSSWKGSKSSVKQRKKGSSSKSSSSESGKKSSKGKKKGRKSDDSSRSDKSTSTKASGPTSVKVVSVPPPMQRQNNACPPPFPMPSKDEVTTVMATSGDVHPIRDLQRVRAPSTVPKSYCGSTVSTSDGTPSPHTSAPPVTVSSSFSSYPSQATIPVSLLLNNPIPSA